jgi:hypothetical protein
MVLIIQREVMMPFDAMLVIAGVVAVFVAFAGVQLWGDFQTRPDRLEAEKSSPKLLTRTAVNQQFESPVLAWQQQTDNLRHDRHFVAAFGEDDDGRPIRQRATSSRGSIAQRSLSKDGHRLS